MTYFKNQKFGGVRKMKFYQKLKTGCLLIIMAVITFACANFELVPFGSIAACFIDDLDVTIEGVPPSGVVELSPVTFFAEGPDGLPLNNVGTILGLRGVGIDGCIADYDSGTPLIEAGVDCDPFLPPPDNGSGDIILQTNDQGLIKVILACNAVAGGEPFCAAQFDINVDICSTSINFTFEDPP